MLTITWKLRLSVSALTLKCSRAGTNPVKSFRHHDECWCTKCLHQLEIGIGKGKSRGKTERVALKPMSQEVFLTLTKDFLHSLTHCLIFFYFYLWRRYCQPAPRAWEARPWVTAPSMQHCDYERVASDVVEAAMCVWLKKVTSQNVLQCTVLFIQQMCDCTYSFA